MGKLANEELMRECFDVAALIISAAQIATNSAIVRIDLSVVAVALFQDARQAERDKEALKNGGLVEA